VAEALSGLGHPVAAVDQRGHGLSDKPDDGYDFVTLTNDLLAVMSHLQWSRPVVAGQSWGANVVLELGWLHPDQVRGVVLIDGGWIELSDRFATVEEAKAALAPPKLAGRPLAEFEAMLRKGRPDWPEAGIQGTLANFEIHPDGTVAPWLTFDRHLAILEEFWRHRPSTRYAGMKVPVLLIPASGRGPAGKGTAVAAAESAIPQARTRWFTADHDVHAQHPAEVAAELAGAVDDGFFA
jgi:pimeloyl-ACP methyl ester carboxylesterase